MSPNPTQVEYVLNESEYEKNFRSQLLNQGTETDAPLRDRKYEYRWDFIAYLAVFHIQAVYGMYLSFTSAKLLTNVFGKSC